MVPEVPVSTLCLVRAFSGFCTQVIALSFHVRAVDDDSSEQAYRSK